MPEQTAPTNPYNLDPATQNTGTSATTSTPTPTTTSSAYQNPSQPSNLNPQFGTSSQFNIPGGVIKPFNYEQQRAEDSNYLSGFSNFLNGQEKLPALQQRYENRYGIPDLQENYLRQKETQDMVGNQIRGLEDNVKQRASGTMLTQAQVDRMVSKEAKGLLEQFNSLGQITEQTGQRLAMAEQNLNSAAKLEMAQMQKDMTPWMQAYEMKNIMQAREFSGWGTVQQLELNRLMANQSAGLTWTNSEAQRANALAMQANGFAHDLDMLEKQSSYAMDLWG
jgi:hypothetical protein